MLGIAPKITALFLAVLMGLMPLQGVLAKVVPSTDQAAMVKHSGHAMSDPSSATVSMDQTAFQSSPSSIDHSEHDHDTNCLAGDCCQTLSCSTAQCGSCGMLVGISSVVDEHADPDTDLPFSSDLIINLVPSSLFRPPRV